MQYLTFFFGWISFTIPLAAQIVSVRSNVENANVYINSTFWGKADGKRFFEAAQGTYKIQLILADSLSWTLPSIERNVPLFKMDNKDTLFVDIPFPYTYQFTSLPFGEKVYGMGIMKQKKLLGTTPLRYASFEQAEKFWIETETGASDTLYADQSIFKAHLFTRLSAPSTNLHLIKNTKKNNKVIPILSSLVALSGGTYAAYHKLRADNLYFGEYAQTGNPLLKQEINKLDRKAMAGVWVMQTGIISLVINLIKR